jgi:hypothetical protein
MIAALHDLSLSLLILALWMSGGFLLFAGLTGLVIETYFRKPEVRQ